MIEFVKQNAVFIGFVINAIGSIFAIIKFTKEQKKTNDIKEKELKRLEYKLKIYNLLLDKELSYSKLNQLLSYGNPLGDIDEIELRICLYEMLVEKTIVIDEQRRYTVDVVESETD